MLFNSQAFILLFLPATLLLFLFLWGRERPTWALITLIGASLFFYGWWNPVYIPLLVGSVLFNFTIAHLMVHRNRNSWQRAALLMLGVSFNLFLLGYFKYADFFLHSFGSLTGAAFTLTATTLPLAISFYTFQQISYLVDVWRNRGGEHDLLHYAAYVTFFPQLIAGPIVRHDELIPQLSLDPLRYGFWERLGRGTVLFCIGLAKKVFIADEMARIVDPAFADAAANGAIAFSDAWLGAGAFACQIYFDFSGYSDMALGLAYMFGFRLPANFNAPYRAASLREFWHRWHMTLSLFLRDYLYVAFGGNRKGEVRRYLNLIVTMLLGGLWHGAGWTFVVWGFAHGMGLAVNSAFDRTRFILPRGVGWLLTLVFWIETMILFRAETFDTAWVFFSAMHGWNFSLSPLDAGELGLVFIAAMVAIIGPTSQDFAFSRLVSTRRAAIVAGIVLASTTVVVGGEAEREFIYFQF